MPATIPGVLRLVARMAGSYKRGNEEGTRKGAVIHISSGCLVCTVPNGLFRVRLN